MQILPENVKILTWILHDFCLNFTVGGVSKPSILLTMVGVNTPGPCWTKTLKSLEPPLQYIENFQSPPFNARKYFGAPP